MICQYFNDIFIIILLYIFSLIDCFTFLCYDDFKNMKGVIILKTTPFTSRQLSFFDSNTISGLIRKIMAYNEINDTMAAECIGCTVGSFKNKVTKDRFSIKELLIIAELAGYHLALIPENETKETEYLFSDAYISDDERAKMKEYSLARIQTHLDVLNTYMVGMTPDEKEKFVSEHLPGMIKGTDNIKPKK